MSLNGIDTANRPSVAQLNLRETFERIGSDHAAAMLAELDIWANRAELLHDEMRATMGLNQPAGVSSWTLDAIGRAFYDMPVLPPGALVGSPLREDGGALAMAARLWPALVDAKAKRGEVEESNLVCCIETAFHIARVALVVQIADMQKLPGASGALELMQSATCVASRIIEPSETDTDGQEGGTNK